MLAFRTLARTILPFVCIGFASAAHAGPPEQLYETGPEAGTWQLEYNGQFGNSAKGERPHSIEIFRGISESVALGFEIEGEQSDGNFRVEEFGLEALVALTGENADLEAAVLLKAGISTDGDFPQLESRFILEHESEKWNLLGNVNLLYAKGDETGTSVGYAVAAHRNISEHFGLGIESSGQIARLSGYDDGFERAQYVGPSVRLSWEIGEAQEIEIGLKYLRRIDAGDENRDTLRIAAGFTF
jgi:hypothetical protein